MERIELSDEDLRIDPATRRVRARIPVPGDARVATGAGAVWALAGDLLYAADQGPVRLLRIDPATNRVVARIPMRSPAGERFGPLDLQVDGTRCGSSAWPGRALWRTALPGDVRFSIADGDVLWAQVSRDSAGPDQLFRLDAAPAAGSATSPCPSPASPASPGPGGRSGSPRPAAGSSS